MACFGSITGRKLRHWRAIVAVVVAIMYLLAGQLHGAHDIDVTSPAGGSEIAMIVDGAADHADNHALAGHHCHGCFSIAVEYHLQDQFGAELPSAAPSRNPLPLIGLPPGIEPRPPNA